MALLRLTVNPIETLEITITREGIVKLLKNLKTNKAAGLDDLAPTVLKGLSAEIAPVLQKSFTKSLQSHIVPSDWKKARISPIFKKGDKIDLRTIDRFH